MTNIITGQQVRTIFEEGIERRWSPNAGPMMVSGSKWRTPNLATYVHVMQQFAKEMARLKGREGFACPAFAFGLHGAMVLHAKKTGDYRYASGYVRSGRIHGRIAPGTRGQHMLNWCIPSQGGLWFLDSAWARISLAESLYQFNPAIDDLFWGMQI
jgi:hypothetical protein